ncbi:Nuclear receptor subfamily 4 group A member 3 [Struthio camelus australis]|uniref:Nuclear receptor subfamily 4 group A member 2 n=1 Tax=Struthio camelus australis TaxID=441894 RepID=A0A093I1N3_STRCA|nr:Nuclear receptor subfamily 4 group A member 3 [Struthio camelus australis]
MPCVQAQYSPSPPGSSYAAQTYAYGSEYGSEIMNPDYAKLTMDLSSTEITATATTSLPSFSTFMEGYSGSYELKPSCLYQMQSASSSGQRPLIKMEDARLSSYQQSLPPSTDEGMPSTSMYFKQSPPSTPTTPGFPPHQSLWDEVSAEKQPRCYTVLAASPLCSRCVRELRSPAAAVSPALRPPKLTCPLLLDLGACSCSLNRFSLGVSIFFQKWLKGRPLDRLGAEFRAAGLRFGKFGFGSKSFKKLSVYYFCVAFSQRTVQKNAKYVCLANKNCPVDKRRRNRCQYCRFQKCLSVGMVKEVVRTDSLKGRRGRLPSKPKSPLQQEPSQPSPPSPPVSMMNALVRALTDSTPRELDYSRYCSTDQAAAGTDAEHVQQFYNLLTASIDISRGWAERIPGFTDLPKEDQTLLIESAFLELFVLRLSIRSDTAEDKFVFCNGLVLHRLQCLRGFGEWLDSIKDFSLNLKSLNLDIPALASLSALTMITERHGLKEPKKVEELCNKITSSLKDHLAFSCQNKGQPLESAEPKVLGVLADLRSLCTLGLQRIFYLKLEDLVPAPSIIDRLFLDTLPF